MADPAVFFNSITGRKVVGGYRNLPIGTKIVVINVVTQQPMPGVGAEIKVLNARLLIELPAAFPSGDFYLKAEDKSGGYFAQSVVFHVT